MLVDHSSNPSPASLGNRWLGLASVLWTGVAMSLVLKDGIAVVIEAGQTGQHFHQLVGASRDDAVYLAA